MSSPFTFFRSNQTMFMAAIVILSMVAFTLGDLFDQQGGANFLLLGVMIGSIVFAFSGLTNGRWLVYGIVGAVLGGFCGWLLPNVVSPANEAVMNSKLGAFTNKRVTELIQKRSLANQFISTAFDKAFGAGIRQFYSPPQFGYFPQNVQDDMAFGELLRAEADELGIVVTDSMVSDYINNATMQRLTAKDFADARKSLMLPTGPVTEDQVFDALRHEIKAQMAYRQLNPYFAAMPQSPDVYYEMFRRMKVTQRLNTVRLDVDSFVSKVADPSDSEVAAFFAEHQKKYPGMDAPGSHGFRQLPKAKLAYAELNYRDVEAETTPPTDTEIEAYYNENKDQLYKKPVEPVEDPKKEEAPAGTEATPPAAPADGAAQEAPKPEGDAPKTEEVKPADPAAPAAEGEQPKTETPVEAPNAETPVEAPKAEEPKAEEPKAGGEECFPFAQEAEQQKTETPADATPAAEATPAPQVPAAETPAAEASAATPAQAPTEPAAATDAAKPAETPAAPVEGEKPAGDVVAADPPEFVIPKTEYIPLDETLKADIRDRLLDERVRKAIDERMNTVSIALKALEKDRSAARRKIVSANQEIAPKDLYEQLREQNTTMLDGMKTAAEKNKCKFVETRLSTFEDLAEGETYRVGAATDAAAGPFGAAGTSVAQQTANLFPQEIYNDTNLFQQRRAIRNAGDFDGNESHYVWWIVEFAEPHVPELDGPGIRDQVVLEWKRMKARDLAKKRAESMVALVKEDLAKPEAERKGFPVVLEGQTITGDAETTVAAVRQTQTFSWIEQSMTPSMNFQQRRELRLASIPFADEAVGNLRGAGMGFMKTVFEELQNEQPGVAVSENQLIVYVVQPVDRNADEEVLRQQFLTEGKQLSSPTGSGVTELASDIVGTKIRQEWTQALWDKYGVDRGVDMTE
jgi:hypothetical protein